MSTAIVKSSTEVIQGRSSFGTFADSSITGESEIPYILVSLPTHFVCAKKILVHFLIFYLSV